MMMIEMRTLKNESLSKARDAAIIANHMIDYAEQGRDLTKRDYYRLEKELDRIGKHYYRVAAAHGIYSSDADNLVDEFMNAPDLWRIAGNRYARIIRKIKIARTRA